MAKDKDPLNAIDIDVMAFRNSVLMHLARQDLEGLKNDAHAVMAPIFLEQFIEEIGPGNPWNDVLFLMATKLMEASPELRYLSSNLEAKRSFARRLDADLEDLMVVETTGEGFTLRLRE